MSNFNPEIGSQTENFEYRQKLASDVQNLRSKGAKIEDIATLLGRRFKRSSESSPKATEDIYQRALVDDVILSGDRVLLPDELTRISQIVLPTQPDKRQRMSEGVGGGVKERELYPKCRLFMGVLYKLGESYKTVAGMNTKSMVRNESYTVFSIPGLKRVAFVNNEEGEATYIVRTNTFNPYEWKMFFDKSKDELRALGNNKVHIEEYYGSKEGEQHDWSKRIEATLNAWPYAGTAETKEQEKKWVSLSGIAKRLLADVDRSVTTTLRRVGLFIEKKVAGEPGVFDGQVQKLGKSTLVEDNSPLMEAIFLALTPEIEEWKTTENAPEGWMTYQALVNQIRSTISTGYKDAAINAKIEQCADKLILDNPEKRL